MTMLAAMFYGPMDVRLEERPIPLPGEGEVLIQVAAATTCGTDVKTFRRGHPLLFQQVPAGFGHEVAGVIAAVLAAVGIAAFVVRTDATRVNPGDSR